MASFHAILNNNCMNMKVILLSFCCVEFFILDIQTNKLLLEIADLTYIP